MEEGHDALSGAQTWTVEARVHGRCLVVPAAGGGPAPLLVGFHGYGENAERHLRELRAVPGSQRWNVAAVDSLHRFYDRKTGEVVGSWMTRQDRELAIEDNVAYVRSVVALLRRELAATDRLVFVGFSQGVAMAWRAAAQAVERCAGVIALGGDVPPELADHDLSRIGGALLGCGERDEWHTREKLERDALLLSGKGVRCATLVFAAGHEWAPEFRRAAGEFLSRAAD